jgi:PAS domain S-box-containing protein
MNPSRFHILLIGERRETADKIAARANSGLEYPAYTVEYVDNPSEAKECVEQSRVSVIVLDVGDSESKGLEALRLLRPGELPVPVIILTDSDAKPSPGRMIEKGAMDCLAIDDLDNDKLIRSFHHATIKKDIFRQLALITAILKHLNGKDEKASKIEHILQEIATFASVEAAGLRLAENGNYRHYQSYGSPKSSFEAESSLCFSKVHSEMMLDPYGKPILGCLCAAVVNQSTPPSSTFFTSLGSFWSNNMDDFLASNAEGSLLSGERNRCLKEGFSSLALIPLRSEDSVIGILQLNDRRSHRFSSGMIYFFEEMGTALGMAARLIHTDKPPGENKNGTNQREPSESINMEKSMKSKMKELEENRVATLNVLVDLQSEITVRKEMEKNLRRAEESFRSVVDNATDGILISGDDGTYVFCNKFAMDITGYSAGELRGMGIRDLAHPDAYASLQELFERSVDGTSMPERYETIFLRQDKKQIDVELGKTKAVWEGALADIVFFRDITDRKKVQAELLTAKERAERADRLKDSFISNISHEIRTPLNVITGFVNIISEMYSDSMEKDVKVYFETIQRGSARLIRTVDQILNYSRLQVNDLELNITEFDPAAVLMAMLEDVRIDTAEREIDVRFVNEYGPDSTMRTDQYCFTQVIQNLLDNAIKFTKQGAIEIRMYSSNGQMCIDVRDTGIGISPEYLEHIFDPFTQEEMGFSRSYEGIGLGLALVKKHVDLLGADISVQSSKGLGTNFTICFNTAKTREPKAATKPAAGETHIMPNRSESESKPLVLVVEDDKDTITYMKIVLGQRYETLWADSSEQVWEILSERMPDIILMDISLQGTKSGIAITQDIRADSRVCKIPILAVTAHAFPQDRAKCLDAGCNEYIRKPVNRKDLFAMMKELLTETEA